MWTFGKCADRITLGTGRAAIALALSSAAFAQPAAANVCVACTGPDAAYSCVIEGSAISADDARAKLLCITELAKSGGHQSCAVSRAVTAPCPGEVRTVVAPSADGAQSPQPAAGAAAPTTEAAPASDRETTVPKSSDPNTVDGSGSTEADTPTPDENGAFEKAGKAVTDAAKSTWKCLSSFFGDC